MRALPLAASALALTLAGAGWATTAAAQQVHQGKTSTGEPCEIIQSGRSATGGGVSGSTSAGSVSTSISAGNGHVSGETSGPGGTIHTGEGTQVKFGDGSAVAASSVNASSTNGSGTMTASANGKTCIVSEDNQ